MSAHITFGKSDREIGSGLLGASIRLGLGGVFDPKELANARLLEIERRILAIEARLNDSEER